MYCTKCGEESDGKSNFCTKCGTGLTLSDQSNKHIKIEKISNIFKFEKISNIFKFEKISNIFKFEKISNIFKFEKISNIFKFEKISNIFKFENRKILKIVIATFGLLTILSAIIIFIPNFGAQVQNTVDISINSIPSGADVYIEGNLMGQTPLEVGLSEGNYPFKLQLLGYKTLTTDFNVTTKPKYETTMEINATFEIID